MADNLFAARMWLDALDDAEDQLRGLRNEIKMWIAKNANSTASGDDPELDPLLQRAGKIVDAVNDGVEEEDDEDDEDETP